MNPIPWRRWADKFLGPEYLFPLVLWIVIDRGSLRGSSLFLVIGLTLVTLALPKITQLLLIKHGLLSETTLKARTGRLNPWAIGSMLAGLLVPLTLVRLFSPDPGLLAYYLALIAMVAVAWPLTYWLKVSGHAMGSAAALAAALAFAPPWIWLFLPLMVLVCFSRLALGAHTPREVLVGALVGFTVPLVIFGFFL
jgi:membrane-associated phospholipid phosphatase